MPVIFTYQNGKTRKMSARDAKVLQRLKYGTYEDDQITSALDAQSANDDLDALDTAALRVLAKEHGVKLPPRIGDEKIRSMIREAAQ